LIRLDEIEDPSPEEKELAELLTVLIDDYEERRYPIRKFQPSADASPSHGGSQPLPKGPLETSDRKASLPRSSTASVPSAKPRPKN
jgi:hypothetical protein